MSQLNSTKQQLFISANNKILTAQNILLVTHNRPDGDALSSICALAEYLTQINKSFFAYCLDAPPPQYSFLPQIDKVNSNKSNLRFSNYDMIIALDCGSLSRTNLVQEISNKTGKQFIIEFDHHPKVDDYADIEIRIPFLSSTAEVLYHFFKINQIKFTKNIANCILTGILTDTGNLLYESTTKETVKIASQMLTYGASYPSVLENTWRNKSLAAMKIWGKAMSNLVINKKYNIAYSILKYEDIKNSEATDEELEGAPGFLSNLKGVSALMLLREEKPGLIKGSLRTTSPHVDVAKFASLLGGGGHKRASGFVVKGSIIKKDNRYQIK